MHQLVSPAASNKPMTAVDHSTLIETAMAVTWAKFTVICSKRFKKLNDEDYTL